MKKSKKTVTMVMFLSVIFGVFIGVFVTLFIKDKFNKDVIKEETEIQEVKQQDDIISTVEQQIQDEDAIIIDTDYTKLYYPKKWESNLETEIVKEDGYVVNFYCQLDGKDKQLLFEIVYNSDADQSIGIIEKEESIYIGFNLAEIKLEEGWTTEETDTIYAMQEDINYLIGMLEKEEGFTK